MTAYVTSRDNRFWYASDVVAHLEERCCSLGCRYGALTAVERAASGPGGSCDVLARVSQGDGDVIPEVDDNGKNLTCLRRVPIKRDAV